MNELPRILNHPLSNAESLNPPAEQSDWDSDNMDEEDRMEKQFNQLVRPYGLEENTMDIPEKQNALMVNSKQNMRYNPTSSLNKVGSSGKLLTKYFP